MEKLPEKTQTCPSCKTVTYVDYYFCPMCGKSLRSKPLSTSVGKQIAVYALSIFLPPLGFIPAWNYLRQSGSTAKTIGWVCLILSIVSTIVTIYYSVVTAQDFMKELHTQLTIPGSY